MKNVVFIPTVQGTDPKRLAEVAYDLSIKSWSNWCKKNNCELFVMQELIHDYEEMKITWQRYYVLELLENSGIEYDQVCMVDADTIVHPDCPNFFEMTNHKYTGVHNEGSYDWILRSIENYSKHIFQGREIDWWKYINGGFQIVNKKHKFMFKSMIEFYNNNKDNLITMQNTYHTGTDQTPMNFMLQTNNIETTLLPYEFNMIDLNRKELLTEQLPFTDIGYVYQYNGIPNNKNDELTLYWMKKTYEELYEN